MLWNENVRDLVVLRVCFLRSEHSELSISYFIIGSTMGEYGVILYSEYGFNPIGFEFIESRTSWQRSEAIRDYCELTEGGYCVLVYVPSDVLSEVARNLSVNKAKENIKLLSIERLVPTIEA
jgi:hypothetical protein